MQRNVYVAHRIQRDYELSRFDVTVPTNVHRLANVAAIVRNLFRRKSRFKKISVFNASFTAKSNKKTLEQVNAFIFSSLSFCLSSLRLCPFDGGKRPHGGIIHPYTGVHAHPKTLSPFLSRTLSNSRDTYFHFWFVDFSSSHERCLSPRLSLEMEPGDRYGGKGKLDFFEENIYLGSSHSTEGSDHESPPLRFLYSGLLRWVLFFNKIDTYNT